MPSEIRSTADLQAGSFHLIYCINSDIQWVDRGGRQTYCYVFCYKNDEWKVARDLEGTGTDMVELHSRLDW